MENKYIGKKLVDIKSDIVCYGPFNSPFKGSKFNQILSTGDIRYLLARGAKVTEILSSGRRVELDLDNYDSWLDEGDAPSFGYKPKIVQKEVKKEETIDKPVEESRRNKKKEKNRRKESDQYKQEHNQHSIEDDISEPSEGEEDVLDQVNLENTVTEEDLISELPEGLTPEEEDKWLEDNLQ